MCNLYAMTGNQQAIREAARVMTDRVSAASCGARTPMNSGSLTMLRPSSAPKAAS